MRRLLILLLVASSLGFMGRGGVPCDRVQSQPQCLVALLPGPTANTLDIVEIAGDTSLSAGELLLTTVSVDPSLTFREWVRGAFDSRVDHFDRELIYPTGTSVEEVRAQNVALMENSQLDSMIAALHALDYDFDEDFDGAEVVEVAEYSAAADGTLLPGDVIVDVAGTRVSGTSDVVGAIARFGIGDDLALVVQRDGSELPVTIQLVAAPDDGRPVMGVTLRSFLELPVQITIDAGIIGGPSAGLMFAVAIVDELSPEDLTGGLIIAGTGEIDRLGTVGPIGGIRQKVLGATSRGDEPPATVFLVPELNMPMAVKAPVRSEILLVPIGTLDDALEALRLLRDGQEPVGAVRLKP